MSREQLTEVRQLIEQNGFLPHSPKALRLFEAAQELHPGDPDLPELRRLFEQAGYLPRSKALKLVEKAG